MLSAWWFVPGLLLAQTELPRAPAALGIPTPAVDVIAPGAAGRIGSAGVIEPAAATMGAPLGMPADPITAPPAPNPPAPATEPTSSIFSRPLFASRHSLSWLLGSGPGRFEMIDWESRPNGDHLWWLGRWPSAEEVHLYADIGFNIHWWAGPVPRGDEPAVHLPPRVYDLYLDFSWAQSWSDSFATEVRFRPGLYTDFRTTPPDAFRIPGHALGLFRVDPELFLVGGVEYLERNDVHLLPVGGILWQPTPEWELRLMFPEPKIAVELSSSRNLWGYVAAEYGGGRWTFKNDAGQAERVEVSDYRIACGIEWREDYFCKLPVLSQKSAKFLELGYIFERHIRFAGPTAGMDPKPAWMIRFGHAW